MGLSGCGPVVRNGLVSATLTNGGDCTCFVGGILHDLSLVLDFEGNFFFYVVKFHEVLFAFSI